MNLHKYSSEFSIPDTGFSILLRNYGSEGKHIMI